MRPEKLALDLKSNTRFTQTILQKFRTNEYTGVGINDGDIADDCIGGVVRDGQFGWVAVGAHLEVYSLKTGTKVASHSFDSSQRLSNTVITCVTEIQADGINSCLLLVGVQCSPIGGLLYVFSVQGSRVIHRIDVIDKVTSCCYVDTVACRRSSLKMFDGCAAIGTDDGKVLLMDLNLTRCKEIIYRRHVYNSDAGNSTCRIILASEYELYEDIVDEYRRAKRERINFGIQLEVLDQPTAIVSILSLSPLLTIAVGLGDGRMVLYNLAHLAPFHLAHPPELNAPLTKLTFLEPADDPRACVYIWAFHSSSRAAIAVMHSITFESKTIQDDECLYEKFQSCSPRLTIPIRHKRSMPVACQSISKVVCDEEDELLSLCLLGWTAKESGTKMLLFDLNQWYKEQMPDLCEWQDYPSYLAPFPIEGADAPLDIWLSPRSVATFNSIQRPEEHFYPTSLSFDCAKLAVTSVYRFHWPGLQNKALQRLNAMGAAAILEPDECFTDILETNLFPQLSAHNYHANPSTRIKQEFLLSMALEYNCMGLLRECARQWCDGSHMGNRPYDEGLTLSTLTDWVWSQATEIKDCCNNLCVPLFDHSGITIDLRSRKILAQCSRQLKLLADLLDMIVTNCRQYIPDEIFDTLCCQRNSIRMTGEYQEVLQWLLNMGLLPEVAWNQFSRHDSRMSLACTPDMLAAEDAFAPVPYPYQILSKYYTEQRQKFYEIDRSFITPKRKSCRCLYIDEFIERECNSPHLREEWKNSHGDALYPPPSLQAMLRILLVPGISLESKYALFIYLFLDLNTVLEDERYVRVVRNLIKFPAVFKLNSTLIKTTQAFWNLDHKEYETAIDELISPLTNDRFISTWQQELLVHTLLVQDMPNLALRALRAPGPPIGTVLEIKTLLANNLITEAFELQRTKFDDSLLLEFYKGCHHLKKWNHVLGLALTEREGHVLLKFLRSNESLLSENLQLLYLLQRNKYVEALTYLDGLKCRHRPAAFQRQLDNTQGSIFSAFKMGMAPSERKLSDLFLSIKDRIGSKRARPSAAHRAGKDGGTRPFSSDMNTGRIDSNANIIGDLFHRAILSTKSASESFAATANNDNDSMQDYVPFLSKPAIDFECFEFNSNKPVTYPTAYSGTTKRRKEIAFEDNRESEYNQPAKRLRTTEPTTLLLRTVARGLADNSRDEDGEIDGETVNLLSTPVVKTSRIEKHATNQSSRCQTPHSILKHRRAESVASRRSVSPTLTVNSARRSVDFDERSFRFGAMQSTTANSSAEEYRLTAIPETVVDSDLEQNSPYGSVKARMPLHGADTSAMSTSADEFYSPENTKLSDRPSGERYAGEKIHRDFEEMTDNSNDSEKAKGIEPDRPSSDVEGGAKRYAGDGMHRDFEEMTDNSNDSEKAEGIESDRPSSDVKGGAKRYAGEKIHRDFEEMTDNSNDSEKATEIEPKPVEEKISKRSTSREPTTRITRSRSKLNLDGDGVDGMPKMSDQLDTSTPLRTIRGRTPLSKAVHEMKTFAERNAIEESITTPSVPQSVASTDDDESCPRILDDNSDLDESMMRKYLGNKSLYSEPSIAYTPSARRNILEDSSAFGHGIFDRSEATSTSDEMQKESEPTDTYESEQAGEAIIIGDTTDEKSHVEEQPPVDDKSIERESVEEPLPEEVEEVDEKEEIEESMAQMETGQANVGAESVLNVLTDNSDVTESFVKRYVHTNVSTVYSETSTIFYSSTRATNVLEESSFGPTLAQHTLKEVADEPPADLFQSRSSSDNENDVERENRGTTRNKYESDVEELNDSSSSNSSNDSSATNGSNSSSSSTSSNRTTSSNGSSVSKSSSIHHHHHHARPEADEADVINISSGSEEDLPLNRDEIVTNMDVDLPEESFGDAAIKFTRPEPTLGSHAIFSLPGDDRPPSANDYIITEMFSTPMDEMPDSSADLLPTQSISDIVYGDLDDLGMGDAANEEDIYVEEAISLETQPQDNLLEPIESTTSTEVELEAEIVPDTMSTDTLDRGFVDDGEALAHIEAESSDMAKSVEHPAGANDGEVNTTEAMATDVLNVAFVTNEATAEEKEAEAAADVTHVEEETNVFEKAIIVEPADSGVVDRTVTDETISQTPAMKYVVDDEQPSTSGIPSKKRRRSVSVSSSSSSQMAIAETVTLPTKRSSRAKSVASDSVATPTTPKLRPRRAVSQQNLNEISEAIPARINTRRQSATLDTISELPKTPTTRRRKASESSEVAEQPKTPNTRRRKASESSVVTEQLPLPKTPSARRRKASESSEVAEQPQLPKTPTTRRRKASESSEVAEQPKTPNTRRRKASESSEVTEQLPLPKTPSARRRKASESSEVAEQPQLPKTPTTRRRKASESSEVEISSMPPAAEPKTPRRSLRSHGSDAESVTSTPSSHRQSVDRESSTTPSTRSRRKIFTSQQESPSEPETGAKATKAKATPSKRTSATRSSTKDDDEISETSSIASSVRSSRSLRTPITEIDDDNVSMKSARSTKRTRPTSTLPPIDEDAATPARPSVDYMAAARLTRAQKATLEKYSTKQRQPETPTTPRIPRRVPARRQSTMDSIVDADEDITDNSDSKSIASDTSRISKSSKASKASMASRSSKRLRNKK